MKPRTYMFSETYQDYDIDAYMDEDDDGPYWPVVDLEAYDDLKAKLDIARKALLAVTTCGEYCAECLNVCERALEKIGPNE